MKKTPYWVWAIILMMLCVLPLGSQFILDAILSPNAGSVISFGTPYEYALMSNLAYLPNDDPLQNELQQLNWKVLASTNPSGKEDRFGYFAVALRNEESGEIVIAHRGTNPNLSLSFFAGDVLDDMGMFFGAEPKQLRNSAEPFLRKLCEHVVKDDPVKSVEDCKHSVIQTGHSLGAALAELSAYYNGSRAITFDSPGTGSWIHDIAGNAIISYVGSPNIVNTANPHVGTLIMVDKDWLELEKTYREKDTPIPNLFTDAENRWRYIQYTIEAAHPLEKIMGFLGAESTSNWRDVSKCWITGAQAGYRSFLIPDPNLISCLAQ